MRARSHRAYVQATVSGTRAHSIRGITATDCDREHARTRLQVATVARAELNDHARAKSEASDDEARVMECMNALGECAEILDYLCPRRE